MTWRWNWLERLLEPYTKAQISEREINLLADVRQTTIKEHTPAIVNAIQHALGKTSEEAQQLATNAIEIARQRNDYIDDAQRLLKNEPLQGRVRLTVKEATALIEERQTLFAQGNVRRLLATVSLCSFLQGFLQSSINAASLYADLLGIPPKGNSQSGPRDWYLGLMNASVFLTAAFVGAPAALILNYIWGRRGAIMIAAALNIIAALAAAAVVPLNPQPQKFMPTNAWVHVLGIRIIAGVAMGVKAISAPLLASETATGYWRGSTMLSWQLIDALGIAVGALCMLLFGQIKDRRLALQLILGAPMVPAAMTIWSVSYCYESPRYFIRRGTSNFNLTTALRILVTIRPTELQAVRDFASIYLTTLDPNSETDLAEMEKPGLTYAKEFKKAITFSWRQYTALFKTRRHVNAVYTVCLVNLAQQTSGVNVFAFYSNVLFGERLHYSHEVALGISFAFGAVNCLFGLLAVRSIDTLGRRHWMLVTLPLMSIFLFISAMVLVPFDKDNPNRSRTIASTVFIFLFACAYSPGAGPVPFTLSSEAFHLSYREAGASIGTLCNLSFAGLLTIVYPAMDTATTTPGALGIFSALNLIVFVLVLFYMEETRRLNLEELDLVFGKKKRQHVKYQREEQLPYAWALVKHFVFPHRFAKPVPPLGYDEYIQEADDDDPDAAETQGRGFSHSWGTALEFLRLRRPGPPDRPVSHNGSLQQTDSRDRAQGNEQIPLHNLSSDGHRE